MGAPTRIAVALPAPHRPLVRPRESRMVVDQDAAPSWVRRADHYRMLRECRYEELIRADFRGLFGFTAATTGSLLDAGCGTGNETVELQRQAPRLRIHG